MSGVVAVKEQLNLIPDEVTQAEFAYIPLNKLPADGNLAGGDPSTSLVNSVSNFGVRQPIEVEKRQCGYFVRFGRRRVKAARRAGLLTIPAMIVPTGWTRASVVSLIENGCRSDNMVSDLLAVESLVKHGYSDEAIYEATGVVKARLTRIRKMQSLIPALREGLLAGQMRDSVAEAAARLPQASQQELAALLEATGKLTGPDVDAVRQAHTGTLVDALPARLFATPDSAGGSTAQQAGTAAWRAEVAALLAQALALVPASETAARTAIAQAAVALDGGAA